MCRVKCGINMFESTYMFGAKFEKLFPQIFILKSTYNIQMLKIFLQLKIPKLFLYSIIFQKYSNCFIYCFSSSRIQI